MVQAAAAAASTATIKASHGRKRNMYSTAHQSLNYVI